MFFLRSLLFCLASFSLSSSAAAITRSSTPNSCAHHIDESSLSLKGQWAVIEQAYDVGGTASYPTASGDSFRVEFSGSKIEVLGSLHANSSGVVSYSVDGAIPVLVTYNATTEDDYQTQFWSSSELDDKSHTLEVTVVQAGWVGFDYFIATSAKATDGVCLVDVINPNVAFTGTWNEGGMQLEFEETVMSSNNIGDFYTVVFTGTQIQVLGTLDYASGGVMVDYSIDGGDATRITYNASADGLDNHQQDFWTSPVLAKQEHMLNVTMVYCSGVWDPSQELWGEGTIWFDDFKVSGA